MLNLLLLSCFLFIGYVFYQTCIVYQKIVLTIPWLIHLRNKFIEINDEEEHAKQIEQEAIPEVILIIDSIRTTTLLIFSVFFLSTYLITGIVFFDQPFTSGSNGFIVMAVVCCGIGYFQIVLPSKHSTQTLSSIFTSLLDNITRQIAIKNQLEQKLSSKLDSQ